MSKKNQVKRISISAFEKIMKDTYEPTSVVEWNGVEIVINRTLPLKEALTFVNSVVQSCFDADDNAYLPEIKDFAIRCCILELYTNLAMPSNPERKYDLVYCTDAVSVVMEHINKVQLDALVTAINDKVANMAQANIEAVTKQMNKVYATLDSLEQSMSKIFSGVGDEEINTLMSAISGGRFDEEKLVKAYMEQSKSKESDGDE